ncbi:MAG: hypothetical protein JNL60_18405, partial [Bacteroidia bacterium]|nr:hypothetical protein [Bacteroidia bacterium]
LITFFIYLSIFINSFIFFKEPFEFYFGYLIYIVLLPVFITRYGWQRELLGLFLILLLTGLLNIFIGNNTPALFFKVFIGLLLSYYFYYYVIREFKFDVQVLFKWYMYGSYIASLIGIIQYVSFLIEFSPGYDFSWLLNKWAVIKGGNYGIRINSIFAEPTYLASTLSAAFFVSLYNLIRKENFYISKMKSVVIILAYILSFSGVGQTGIFLTLLFLVVNFGIVRYMIWLVPASIILFNFLYTNVSEFKGRYDGIVELFSGEEFKLGKTHGSSFILYNNFHVATENFKTNPFFGSGIGSHPIAFEKHSYARDFKVKGFNSNGADANSMFLRLVSETGLFGICVFMFIVFKCHVRRAPDDPEDYWLISNGILIMILLNLLRQGHYFLNGFPFFVILYYYNWKSYNLYLETGKNLYQHTLEEQNASAEEETV